MINERIEIWKKEEYHYPAAHGFIPVMFSYIHEDEKKHPVMIIAPGGAYREVSPSEAHLPAMEFYGAGYNVFVLEYTINQLDEAALKMQPLHDISRAIRMIRSRAEEFHIRPDRIAVCGFSAGAHNAAMYATNWHTDTISEYFHEDKEKFRPAAAILGYTLSDYIFMRDNTEKRSPMDVAFFKASNTAFLGTGEPSEELLDEVSPARHVTENTPPMYLWATASDELVPVQHSLRMANALAEHKIPFELHVFEEGPHGLGLATQATAAAKSQMYSDAAKWADLAGCWLEKRFAFDLPEKTPFEEMMEKGLIG